MSSGEAPAFQLKCVVPGGLDLEGISELLRHVFAALTEKELDPEWIAEDECLAIEKKTGIVFICDPFSGPAFEHLKSLKFRILGPLCVLECLENSRPFPLSSNPIYNLTMKGLVVCCTNIEKNTREDLHEKIQLMGGEISRGFTELVTHLVANQVGSKKYKVACHYNKSVVLPCWVLECWKASQKQIISAKNTEFNKFRCPIFQGLSVTVTQIDSESRKIVKKLIETNGGEYSGELRAQKTTHLISTAPEGQKYLFAKKWHIKCVHLNWLHDSISNGFCMDEALYEMEETNVKTSTPIGDNNISMLTASNVSTIADATMRSNINETVSMQKSPLQLPERNDKASTALEALDSFNISKLPSNCFLDGCKVFLSGFSGSRLTKVLKMINVGGATRFNNPSNMVSHVIVGEVVKGDLQSLKDNNNEAYIVNVDWLIECCRCSKRVEEAPYEIIKQNPVELLESKSPSNQKSTSVTGKHSEKSKIDEVSNASACGLDDIMCQYLEQPEAKNETTLQNLYNEDADNNEDIPNPKRSPSPSAVITQDTEQEDGLFSGLSFIVIGFSEEDTNIIIEMIEENQGQILENRSKHVPDFAIVPLFGFTVNRTVKEIVTNCWLQVCIENGERLSTDSNELFKPLSIDANIKPLAGCVLSVSQYVGTERECLIMLAEGLGALYQEFFVRKSNPSTNLVPSTHLICMQPEGSKYMGALNWKIPAVSKDWLITCAKFKQKIPEDDFLIGSSTVSKGENQNQTLNTSVQLQAANQNADVSFQSLQESSRSKTIQNTSMTSPVQRLDFSTEKELANKQNSVSTPVNLQFSENSVSQSTLKTNPVSSKNFPRIGVTPGKTPRLQINRIKELISEDRTKTPDAAGIDTPSKFLNPDVEFNPSFDVSEVNQVLNSSATPTGRRTAKRKSSLALEDLFHHQLQNALNENAETSESPSPSNAYRNQRRRILSGKMDKPLFGVIVCVSKKLSSRQSELNNIVAALGGDYRWVFENSCTHFIYQGKSSDSCRELKIAKEQGKLIVCPEWVYACRDNNSKVDETMYPFTFNPNMTLSITPVKVISKQASVEKKNSTPKTRDVSSPNPKEKCDDPCSSSTVAPQDGNCTSTAEVQQVIQRQIDEILLAAEKNKNKRQTKVSSTSFSGENSKNSPRNHTPESNLGSAKKKAIAPVEHSQTVPIVWDDPIDRLEREKIADQLSKESQPVSPHFRVEDHEEVQEEVSNTVDTVISPNGNKENNPVPKLEKPPPKMMLSGMSNQERMNYATLIESLGGSISETQHFDISCTHLIVGQPSRNEKFLASLASGKWILQKSYLEACQQQKRFVEEEEYEWNENSVKQLTGRIDAQTFKLAISAKTWREKIHSMQQGRPTEKRVGAFQNWRVIIHTESQREKSFRRLLEAGGAISVSAKYPYTQSKDATHAFIELAKSSQKDVDFQALVAANIHCLKPEYIVTFLTDGNTNIQNFILPEALAVKSGIASLMKRPSESSFNLSKRVCSR